MSQRPADASVASDDDPLLDAAKASISAVGVRRTTMTEVARRAGVSRMTAYRRYPDVGALLGALMTRELSDAIGRASAEASSLPSARERVVHLAVRGTGLLAAHPLLQRVLEVDPELLLPYVTTRTGEVQQLALSVLAAHIEDGAEDGSIRAGDPNVLAAAVELAVRGFVLSARSEEPEAIRGRMLGELRILVDGYLRPGAAS